MRGIVGAIIVLSGTIMLAVALIARDSTLLGFGGLAYTGIGWLMIVNGPPKPPQ